MTPSLLLAGLILIALPVLPDRYIDPWDLFNPRRNAQIIVLISAFELGGYYAERWLGSRATALVKGFFGGLASSTAVFVTMAHQSVTAPSKESSSLIACLTSIVATFLLFLVIVLTTSRPLLVPLVIPTVVTIASIAFTAVWTFNSTPVTPNGSATTPPSGIQGVLKLSFFVFALLAATTLTKRHLGTEAVEIVSFVSGLFELHATTFAGATLHSLGELTTQEAKRVLLISAAGSLVSKIGIAWVLGSRAFAVKITAAILFAAALGGAMILAS